MTTSDGPFQWYKVREGKRVQAREVKRRKVVRTDRGKIVLEAAIWKSWGQMERSTAIIVSNLITRMNWTKTRAHWEGWQKEIV